MSAVAALSPEQVAQFERDGFLGPLPVLDGSELGAVRDAVARILANLRELEPRLYEVERGHLERPGEVVCHFLGGWLVEPALRDLVFLETIVAPCAQLLGVDALRFFHDQVFAKPPRHPGVVPWHQDWSYWTRTTPCCHVTVNLALDDGDEENGCLSFVPGSHRLPLLPKVPFDAPLDEVRAALPGDFDWRPVAVPARAGHATFHHACTLHGSGPNRTDRWRRNAVLNYMGAHVRVADDPAPLLRSVPHLPRGALVEGEHFPIVWPRAERSRRG